MRPLYILTVILTIFITTGVSCKKFLDEKQDQKLVVPKTVQDLQSLLEVWFTVNRYGPQMGEVSADDYYMTNEDWLASNEYLRRGYVWEGRNLFTPGSNNDWGNTYYNIYRANTVLFYLDKIDRVPGDQPSWNTTKGTAHFLRGSWFAQVAWIWSQAYNRNTASADLGIPLRLTPDFNERTHRSNLQQTYDQIIFDLKEAAFYLPERASHPISPSKSAAFGWLSRVYLSMGEYDSAGVYAGKAISLHPDLMDFNDLNAAANAPIASFNKEVIYHSVINKTLSTTRARIDTLLYNSYDNNDLRKAVYFRFFSNRYIFKGSYDGSDVAGGWFNGIASDEMYLNRAEYYARNGDKDEALQDLNTLMIKRWRNNGTWMPILAASSEEALTIILSERRKELTQRGLRWMDIKRLNKQGANISLRRIINATEYNLQPNDKKYALPIPEDVIQMTGIPQNPQ